MIKKITQQFQLRHLLLAFALMLSSVTFAQTASKNPIYDNQKNDLIEKRDLFAKHYLNEDGSFTASIASAPIHYKKDGIFSNIDNTIQPASSSVYAYANKENLMESYFGASAHNGVKNKTKEGEVLEFLNTSSHWEVGGLKVNVQESANVSVTTIENRAYYKNLYGAIHAEFVVLNGKRKLNYLIQNADALTNAPSNAEYLVFTEKIVLPANWTYLHTENGLTISNDKQTRIYHYSNPYSYDGTGKKLRSNNTIMTVEAQGNTLTIATKVNTDWLLDSDRVYPITIDPTVTVYPSESNYNTGCVYSSDYYKEESLIGFGRYNDNGGVQDMLRGWAKFDLTSVPDDAEIENAISVNYYVSAGSEDFNPDYGHQLIFTRLNIDPVTASGTALYNAIDQFGYGPFVTAAINSIGWKEHTLTSVSVVPDLANGLINNYFSLGFFGDGDFFEGEYLVVDGWEDNSPHLTFTYSQTLGVESFDKSAISMYPNPVENILTVATKDQIESIKIYSLVGQLVHANTDKNTIDVSSLTNGVYLTEIKFSNGQILNKKIVKK